MKIDYYRICMFLLGGRCFICGTTKKLELHHISYPEGKKANGQGYEVYTKRMLGYLKMGIYEILCCKCHNKMHRLKNILGVVGYE